MEHRIASRTGILAAMLAGIVAHPAIARDSLGVFGDWGAFRDPAEPRCYAIAEAQPDPRASRAQRVAGKVAFASVGTWPRRQVRGQISFGLSRPLAAAAVARLAIGPARFNLVGGGAEAWAADPRMDAAIVAAMRSADRMSISALDGSGRRFTDRYRLAGAATAMDAATVGCARVR